MITINRSIAYKMLMDGLCELYPKDVIKELEIEFFELVEAGRNRGEYIFYDLGLYKMDSHRQQFLRGTDDEQKTTVDALKKIFNNSYEKILDDKKDKSLSQLICEKSNLLLRDSEKIVSVIEKCDIKAKTPKQFSYFNNFIIFSGSKVSLYGESWFGLNQFTARNIKYYKSNNETFYLHESVPYLFYNLGLQMGRQYTRNWIMEKAIAQLPYSYDYKTTQYLLVREIVATFINNICWPSEVDEVLLEVQKHVGIEGFMTSKQLTKDLRKFAKSKSGNKIIKAIEDSFSELHGITDMDKELVNMYNSIVNAEKP